MATKKGVIQPSDTCVVERCFCVKGFATNGEHVVIPIENIGDYQYVQFCTMQKWIRSVFLGKQKFDEKLTLAIKNANSIIETRILNARQDLVSEQLQSEQDLVEKVQQTTVKPDVSDDEAEAQSVVEPPKKKSKKVQEIQTRKEFEVSVDGLERKALVHFNGKSIRIEATIDSVAAYLKMIHAEFKNVQRLGLRTKPKEGVSSWVAKLGVNLDEIVIPKVTAKVHYSPSQTSWSLSVADKDGVTRTVTKGLKVDLNDPDGEPLEAMEQMRAIVAAFANAVSEWNHLDESGRKRIDASEFMA